MKSLILAFALMLGATIFVTSCSMDNDGNEASATLWYQGVCDSVVFNDTLDTVYTKYIKSAIETKTIPFVGEYSQFKEEATVKESSISYAQYVCNQQAIKAYDETLSTVSSTMMRSTLKSINGDSVQFDSLDGFKVYYNLVVMYGTGTFASVATYEKKY